MGGALAVVGYTKMIERSKSPEFSFDAPIARYMRRNDPDERLPAAASPVLRRNLSFVL
jgi:hypothetical protein